jgi:hypothetical protein
LLQGRVDVRWLDFSSRPLHVVEADGRVVLEYATESMDTVLCTIPGDPVPRKRIAITVHEGERKGSDQMDDSLQYSRGGDGSKRRVVKK